MKPVLRSVALLIVAVLLLAGCSSPTITTQTTSQPSATTSGPTGNSPGPSGLLTVHFIDVGQGDSILIQYPDGKNMLADGGKANSGALQYLQSMGVKKLDVVVATHSHSDHIGGLVQILKAIPQRR